MISKCPPYIPMPVCTKTIAPPIPNSHYKPGKSRNEKCDKIPPPCFFKNPSKCVEKNNRGMKYKEEIIKKLQHDTTGKLNQSVNLPAFFMINEFFCNRVVKNIFFTGNNLAQ